MPLVLKYKLAWYQGCFLNNSGQKSQRFFMASSVSEVHDMIRKLNGLVISIRYVWRLNYHFSVSSATLVTFFSQLAQLLDSGLDLLSALRTLKHGNDKSTVAFIEHIEYCLLIGNSLSECFQDFEVLLRPEQVAMLSAAELSGNYSLAFNQISSQLLDNLNLSKSLRKATAYPLVLLLLSLAVGAGMLVFVVPRFAEIYQNSNQPLPTITINLLATSAFIQNWFVTGMIAMSFVITGIILSKKHVDSVDKIISNLPLFGRLYWYKNWHQLFNICHCLYRSGVPITKIIEIAVKASEGKYFKTQIQTVNSLLCSGYNLASAFKATSCCPDYSVNLIHNAELSGQLESVFLSLSTFYHQQRLELLNKICAAIEPISIIVVGLMVGIMMLAMYLPIFNMGNVY